MLGIEALTSGRAAGASGQSCRAISPVPSHPLLKLSFDVLCFSEVYHLATLGLAVFGVSHEGAAFAAGKLLFLPATTPTPHPNPALPIHSVDQARGRDESRGRNNIKHRLLPLTDALDGVWNTYVHLVFSS